MLKSNYSLGENYMAISTAIEKQGLVYVYDEKNRQLFTESGTLHGYTSNTVSIKKVDGYIRTFDEKKHQLSCQRG